MARISYVDRSRISDPEIRTFIDEAERVGTPRPEIQLIRAHVPAVISEAELVEMGYLVGVFAGGQRWIHTLQVEHGDAAAESTTGYRAELVRTEKGAP